MLKAFCDVFVSASVFGDNREYEIARLCFSLRSLDMSGRFSRLNPLLRISARYRRGIAHYSNTQPWNRTWTTLTHTPEALTVHALKDTSFPYVWLRDSCQSSDCVHPSTRQKLHRSSDVSTSIAPTDGPKGVEVTPTGIDISWTDGHRSSFTQEFLERHASKSKLARFHYDQHLEERSWTNESISGHSDLFMPYERINTPQGLVDGITQLSKYGLLFVSGVPNEHTSNETCELRTLGERFGELRPTFYGLLWDVINVRNSKNIAYTNLELGLHMDLL